MTAISDPPDTDPMLAGMHDELHELLRLARNVPEDIRAWANPIYGRLTQLESYLVRLEQNMLVALEAQSEIWAKVQQLEAEFAPIARKYARFTGGAQQLPGAGWRGRRGQT